MPIPKGLLSDLGISFLYRHETLQRGYEYATRAFLDLYLEPGDVFIDVGAHWGIFSLQAATRYPGSVKVLAIEPHPLNVKWLKRWVGHNELDSTIEVVAAAVGAKPGRALLRPNTTMGHQFLAVTSETNAEKRTTVPIITLDQEWAKRPAIVDRRVVMKIDVEGSEPDVIAGATSLLSSGKVAAIIWENGRSYRSGIGRRRMLQLVAQLEGLGYAHYRFEDEQRPEGLVPFHPDSPYGNVIALSDALSRDRGFPAPTRINLSTGHLTRFEISSGLGRLLAAPAGGSSGNPAKNEAPPKPAVEPAGTEVVSDTTPAVPGSERTTKTPKATPLHGRNAEADASSPMREAQDARSSAIDVVSPSESRSAPAGSAIFFAQEAYALDGERLMGRHSAGHGFLNAFARFAAVDALWGFVRGSKAAKEFEQFVKPLRPELPIHTILPNTVSRLSEVGCLFFPGPLLGQLAWERRMAGAASWSLCGVTHTLATHRVMDGITDLLVAPIEPWDAIVCTSTGARDVVSTLFSSQAEWLAERLHAKARPLPRLPVIPLGVDCDAYEVSDAERASARKALAIGPDEIAVLFFGRLSFQSKAHPFAMYRALAEAARGHKVVLIEAGVFGDATNQRAFAEARRAACPNVRYRYVDGQDAKACRKAWLAATIFCSLSDNIQETFGLTPIEAMAAGLPVVVADWDGYKDTVRDGIDGFRVPTATPGAGAGQEFALRHAVGVDSYDHYVGYVGQFTAVDVEAASRAFATLFADPELRRRMGAAGRQRAREIYDWKRIVAAYQVLWGELAEQRKRADPATEATRRWPARMDPYALFTSFPSRILNAETRVARGIVGSDELAKYRRLVMVKFARHVLPSEELVERVIASVPKDGEIKLGALADSAAVQDRAAAVRTIAWLAKMGALKIMS
jgi:FkbM family methyltransferase